MATLADLVEQTRRKLRSFSRDRRNTLATTVDSDDTAVVLSSSSNAVPSVGDYIAIDYEVMYVSAVSTLTLTVSRGELGTTAAAHTSGVVVEVAPRFPRGVLLAELRDEIRSWPRDLYSVHTDTVTFGSGDATAELIPDLDTDVYSILAAHRVSDAADGQVRDPQLSIKRGFSASTAPWGYLLQLNGIRYSSATDVDVTYSQAFDTESAWASTTDLEDDIGLAPTMFDIAALGVAWRVMAAADAERTDMLAFTDSRDAQEVPPAYPRQAAEGFRKDRDYRIQAEVSRLRDLWGIRG